MLHTEIDSKYVVLRNPVLNAVSSEFFNVNRQRPGSSNGITSTNDKRAN